MQAALFENLPIQFNADVAKPDLPLFQLAECRARAKKGDKIVVERKLIDGPLFNVKSASMWDGGWQRIYKIYRYIGAGTSSCEESTTHWKTKEEAEAACDRVNHGDESGIKFGSYADD